MKAIMIAFCGALVAAELFAGTAAAQHAVTQKRSVENGRELAVVGCLARLNGKYSLNNAVTVAGPTAVGTAGVVNDPTAARDRWTLHESNTLLVGELGGHVGEQVQIKGHVAANAGKNANAGKKRGSTAPLEVDAIVPLAKTCPN